MSPRRAMVVQWACLLYGGCNLYWLGTVEPMPPVLGVVGFLMGAGCGALFAVAGEARKSPINGRARKTPTR